MASVRRGLWQYQCGHSRFSHLLYTSDGTGITRFLHFEPNIHYIHQSNEESPPQKAASNVLVEIFARPFTNSKRVARSYHPARDLLVQEPLEQSDIEAINNGYTRTSALIILAVSFQPCNNLEGSDIKRIPTEWKSPTSITPIDR